MKAIERPAGRGGCLNAQLSWALPCFEQCLQERAPLKGCCAPQYADMASPERVPAFAVANCFVCHTQSSSSAWSCCTTMPPKRRACTWRPPWASTRCPATWGCRRGGELCFAVGFLRCCAASRRPWPSAAVAEEYRCLLCHTSACGFSHALPRPPHPLPACSTPLPSSSRRHGALRWSAL